MKTRHLFDSDSDVSDLDGQPVAPRGVGRAVASRSPNEQFDDPLSTRAGTAQSARGAAAQDEAAWRDCPPSSQVTATRDSLAQLFGAAPSMSAASAAGAATARALPPAPSAPHGSGIAKGVGSQLFTPSFAYEGSGGAAARASQRGSQQNHQHQRNSNTAAPLGAGVIPGPAEGGVAGLCTALHAVVQVYRDELYCGTCMLVLCVPYNASPSSSVSSASAGGVAAAMQTTAGSSAVPPAHLPPSAAARERMQQEREARPTPAAASPSPPPSSTSSSRVGGAAAGDGPALLLMSANRQVLCNTRLDNPESVFGSGGLQLQQDRAQPQYLTFFHAAAATVSALPSSASRGSVAADGSAGSWWTCMFPDRAKTSEFLVAIYAVAQYAAALGKRAGTVSVAVPTVRVLPSARLDDDDDDALLTASARASPEGEDEEEGEAAAVQRGVPGTFFWTTWTLRRAHRDTLYCLPHRLVGAVPPSTPLEVTPGAGAVREGLDKALVGMRSGESRLVFLTPDETQVRHPELLRGATAATAAPPPSRSLAGARSDTQGRRSASALRAGVAEDEWESVTGKEEEEEEEARALDRPAVALVTCVRPRSRTAGTSSSAAAPTNAAAPPATATAAAPPTPVATDATTATTAALLQQLLVQSLQQQQQQVQVQGSQGSALALLPPPAPPQQQQQQQVASVERALDQVMIQLGSLYEKVDRLDIDGKLQRNNAELERAMKRVVGLAPQNDVAAEDTLKDRDALLASIERYRQQYEEANTNYQRALEAMSRSTERARALERDVQLQQDLWTRQRSEAAEQMRLRLLEKELLHREALERCAEERYAAGRSDGHAAGYREGRQAALTAVDGEGGVTAVAAEWKAKVTARDQQIVALQTALHDAKAHHERDRRQLRAEIDVLTSLNEKLQHMQANADVRMPEESARQQRKRVKATLNSVYTRVEAQLLALPPRHRQSVPNKEEGGDEGEGEGESAEQRLVTVSDALAVVSAAIVAEAQSALEQIREEGEQRARQNAALRDLTAARQHEQRRVLSHDGASADNTHSHRGAVSSNESRRGGPPPMPSDQTEASRSELAAVAAALLPEVSRYWMGETQTSGGGAVGKEGAEGHTEKGLNPSLLHAPWNAGDENERRGEASPTQRDSSLRTLQQSGHSPLPPPPLPCASGDVAASSSPSLVDGDTALEKTPSAAAEQVAAGVDGHTPAAAAGVGHDFVPERLSTNSAVVEEEEEFTPASMAKPSRQALRLPDLPPSAHSDTPTAERPPLPPPPPSLSVMMRRSGEEGDAAGHTVPQSRPTTTTTNTATAEAMAAQQGSRDDVLRLSGPTDRSTVDSIEAHAARRATAPPHAQKSHSQLSSTASSPAPPPHVRPSVPESDRDITAVFSVERDAASASTSGRLSLGAQEEQSTPSQQVWPTARLFSSVPPS